MRVVRLQNCRWETPAHLPPNAEQQRGVVPGHGNAVLLRLDTSTLRGPHPSRRYLDPDTVPATLPVPTTGFAAPNGSGSGPPG